MAIDEREPDERNLDRIEEDGADEEEELRRRRHRERIARMRREKERQLRLQKFLLFAVPAAVVLVVICIVVISVHRKSDAAKPDDTGAGAQTEEQMAGEPETGAQCAGEQAEEELTDGAAGEPSDETQGSSEIAQDAPSTSAPVHYFAQTTASTQAPPEEVNSTNAVFIDLETGNILAQRDCRAAVNPASMTKVLTILVAAEHVTDLDDTFTITIDITDYSYVHDCSNVGFDVGETVTVRDLFYGTILPSGADAAVALATYVAGSHEAFVDLMNEKAAELGLSDTAHFTNCVGLYDEAHHCSVYDMAMIMEAAIDNDVCREVLTAHTYTTSATEQHPEGIFNSNWFLRRIEDKDTGGEVICAKTGYVVQSGNCAVSYGVDGSGRGYVCATTGAHSAWRCIYDHVALYKAYAVQGDDAGQ